MTLDCQIGISDWLWMSYSFAFIHISLELVLMGKGLDLGDFFWLEKGKIMYGLEIFKLSPFKPSCRLSRNSFKQEPPHLEK